jgi:hypothetical protein
MTIIFHWKVWIGKIIKKSIKIEKKFWPTVFLSGLLVGTLDITAALVQFYIKTGKDPLIVPKYIASAVFGKMPMQWAIKWLFMDSCFIT